jgi:hypothetical protein
MIILFTNIPNDSYYSDISKIVEPVIKGGLFKAKGTINAIEIIALKENETDAPEFQALVNIEPEAAALRVIQKLHRMQVKGCRIMVREYVIRNEENDKRSKVTDMGWSFGDRRKNPSRRRDLKVYKIALPEYL